MSPLATVETKKSVKEFIKSISSAKKRQDSEQLLKIIQKITGKTPKVWGDNYLIGFGKYKYSRKGSKEEFEWFNVGFAPRKSNITIYVTYDVSKETELLSKLGKHKVGKGCLYINRLEDVDIDILKQIVSKSANSSWF